MKRLCNWMVLTVLTVACAILPALGQVTDNVVSKRAYGATNAVAIWPGAPGKSLTLTAYDATGDHATVNLQLLTGTTVTRLTAAWSTSTNMTVSSTNGFAPDDIVVLQKASDGTTTWAWVYGLGTSTIQLTATNATTGASGDYVWRMSNTFTNTIASATVRKAGEGLLGAQIRAPLMLRLYSTSGTNEYLNDASCRYEVVE